MTWSFIAHRGSANDKTDSTSKSVNPNAIIAVGRILVVRVSSDNIATASGETNNHTSVSDSKGNTYTKVREQTYSAGAAKDGVTASLWISRITTQLETSDTVTVYFSGTITAKVIALEEFSITGNQITVQGKNGASFASTTTPSVTLSGLTSQEYLWLGIIGTEGPNGDTFTQDSDYANNTSVGTTGGAAASNVSSRFGSRIYTGTSDTYNPTLGTARDCVAILGAILETYVPVIVERSVSEPLGAVTDSVSVAVRRDVSVSEPSISVSDSPATAIVKPVSVNEPAVSVSDAVAYVLERAVSISEPSIPVSDAVELVLRRVRDVSEPAISVLDAVERGLFISREVSEPTIPVSDAPAYNLIRDRAPSESLGAVLDSIEVLLIRTRDISEPAISVLDLAESAITRPVSVSEPPISVSDAVGLATIRAREVLESAIGVSDLVSCLLQKLIEVSEPSIPVSDVISYILQRDRVISEAPISVFDSTARQIVSASIIERTVIEDLGLVTDEVTVQTIRAPVPKRFRPYVFWDTRV